MHLDWWTFALQTVNFGILVWLLHRFLYKPVLQAIDARRAEIEARFAAATTAEAQAREALASVEAQREGIEAERAAALKEAMAQAEAAAEARRVEAQRQADALLDGARKTLAQEREEALDAARAASLDLGLDIARRLLAEVPVELRAEAWLERVEQHLAAMEPDERDRMKQGMGDGAPLRAVTAAPLPEAAAGAWRERLHRALGDGAAIEFADDPALIAGVELHFPTSILRLSWRSTLAGLKAEIENHGQPR
ncbi:MAG: hypothetical protein GC201_01875 [Alphaproteobacteria bacterium]|nr:hypothetical protein [Alphaproteobacteria bacterium]